MASSLAIVSAGMGVLFLTATVALFLSGVRLEMRHEMKRTLRVLEWRRRALERQLNEARLRDAREGETLAGLVGELERLGERLFRDGEPVAATGVRAVDLYGLLGRARSVVARYAEVAKVDHRLALEARRADEARDGAVAAPQGVGGATAGDGDEPVCGAYCRALDLFALEFVKLALKFLDADMRGGEVSFVCRDFVAAKKQAEALKGLAEEVLDYPHCLQDGTRIHDAILAYSLAVWRPRIEG